MVRFSLSTVKQRLMYMQVSTKTRYAVMALVDMVAIQQEEKGENPVNLDKISRRQQISLSYLEQLFMSLRRAGVVKSVRGPGGGYMLGNAPEKISMFDIIAAVNEPLKFNRCNGMGWTKKGSGCMGRGKSCNTHELWSSLGMHMNRFFKAVSLQNILENKVHEILEECDYVKMEEEKRIHASISG
jgi:Rrf2 family iron-sulfur cluster assembly transcriptional regulator